VSDFAGNEELLQDFLTEAAELLSDVDNKLVDLEKRPADRALLNDVFRGFHTIKGGAGFLSATALVELCHRTENLFDKLRVGELTLTPELMDIIMAATGQVRHMFGALSRSVQPDPAEPSVLAALDAVLSGRSLAPQEPAAPAPSKPVANDAPASVKPQTSPGVSPSQATPSSPAAVDKSQAVPQKNGQPDWGFLHGVLTGTPTPAAMQATSDNKAASSSTSSSPAPSNPQAATPARTEKVETPKMETKPSSSDESSEKLPRREKSAAADAPARPRREAAPAAAAPAARETTVRVDTERLDHVLTLSGEIGLIKNRLTRLRSDLLGGRTDPDTLRALDEAVSQLDLLVGNLQNAVMKTRMQPIGRLFNKYPRLARDLARQLGKEVDLVLIGEDTEIDKTMLEDLGDPLVHLVRNAVDHGIEKPSERRSVSKPDKCLVQLSARQEGDHVVIEVTDDGRGMRPDVIRSKAIEKGVISAEDANTLDARGCLNLIFLPGFSTKSEVSSVSGRGVGMDVVKTNIQKLNGKIDVHSEPGKGSRFTISLPLTMAILPVLVVRLGQQPFAVPLSLVREILPMIPGELQQVTGKATMVVRGEVLPVIPLSNLLGWEHKGPNLGGVLLEFSGVKFILAIDSFAGRDDVVIKSLEGFKPRGVAGVTLSSEGQVVLILDLKELLDDTGWTNGGIGQQQARDWLSSMQVT
jgi:two-component system, chemotaxis family, sensor kinase CheA